MNFFSASMLSVVTPTPSFPGLFQFRPFKQCLLHSACSKSKSNSKETLLTFYDEETFHENHLVSSYYYYTLFLFCFFFKTKCSWEATFFLLWMKHRLVGNVAKLLTPRKKESEIKSSQFSSHLTLRWVFKNKRKQYSSFCFRRSLAFFSEKKKGKEG